MQRDMSVLVLVQLERAREGGGKQTTKYFSKASLSVTDVLTKVSVGLNMSSFSLNHYKIPTSANRTKAFTSYEKKNIRKT